MQVITKMETESNKTKKEKKTINRYINCINFKSHPNNKQNS